MTDTNDARDFIAAIRATAPNAEPVIVSYNPDGSGWSVYDRAKHPPRFFAETPTDDTRALVIAARKVAYSTIHSANPADFRALERALERYASSIGSDGEPLSADMPLLHANDIVIDQIAARMAKADGLDWDEICGYQTDAANCDSDTCVAAWFEDHDADWARAQYRKYARAALGITQPARSYYTQPAEAVLGESVICTRCNATIKTYGDACTASLDDACPGFVAIEAAVGQAQAGERA